MSDNKKNSDYINVSIPTKIHYKFDLKKFAEYKLNKIIKDSENKYSEQELNEFYDDCYCNPQSQSFTSKDIKYMLNNNILIKLEEEEIDPKHIDEYLYEE